MKCRIFISPLPFDLDAGDPLIQVVQILGAVLVLAGFVLVQMRKLSPSSMPYLVLNLVGAAILAVLALIEEQWGFLLLNGVWSIIGAWGILRALRGGSPPATH